MSSAATCVIDAGRLYCGGNNHQGMVGNGLGTGVFPVARVGTADGWTRISGSGNTLCGILNGAVYCWGLNRSETVAPGPDSIVNEPLLISDDGPWSEITTGQHYACGIRRGELWCWGRSSLYDINSAARPLTRIGGRADWQSISASRHAGLLCGVAGGEAYCWGRPLDNDENSPLKVSEHTDWSRVTTHSEEGMCGLREGGRLMCWDTSEHPSIGSSVDDEPMQMVDETGFWSIDGNATRICALRENELWCFGRNTPESPVGPQSVDREVPPTRLWPEMSFDRVASHSRNCATSDGELWCWGAQNDGVSIDDEEPRIHRVTFDGGWTQLSIGTEYTCGIQAGDLYCWGRRPYRPGFDLDAAEQSEPVPALVDNSRAWDKIASNSTSFCALSSGELYCTGNERSWNGAFVNGLRPFDSELGWTDLSAFASINGYCGIRAGELHCWNQQARLSLPVGIHTDWSQVSVGFNHQCAIRSGELYCWGENRRGQLGLGDDVDRAQPERVGTWSDWEEVRAGYNATCARRGMQMWCFGWRSVFATVGSGNQLTPILLASDALATGHPYSLHSLGACRPTAEGLVCGDDLVLGGSIEHLSATLDTECMIHNRDVYCMGRNSDFRWGMPEPLQPRLQTWSR